MFQYSGGAAAEPGFRIERVTFRNPMPLVQGFERIAAIIKARGRPLTAFCACELRSPAPFTDAGFRGFNEALRRDPRQMGHLRRRPTKTNPVARSNVCPEIDPPAEPSFHAFSFTVAAAGEACRPSWWPAAAKPGRAGPATASAPSATARPSAEAMREKAVFVLAEMERRLKLLGFTWAHTTATQVYTVHDLYPFLADEIVRRGAARGGLTWHFCRPPVQGLEYEMDCRGVAVEHSAE